MLRETISGCREFYEKKKSTWGAGGGNRYFNQDIPFHLSKTLFRLGLETIVA
jgi:hypothetical protein